MSEFNRSNHWISAPRAGSLLPSLHMFPLNEYIIYRLLIQLFDCLVC